MMKHLIKTVCCISFLCFLLACEDTSSSDKQGANPINSKAEKQSPFNSADKQNETTENEKGNTKKTNKESENNSTNNNKQVNSFGNTADKKSTPNNANTRLSRDGKALRGDNRKNSEPSNTSKEELPENADDITSNEYKITTTKDKTSPIRRVKAKKRVKQEEPDNAPKTTVIKKDEGKNIGTVSTPAKVAKAKVNKKMENPVNVKVTTSPDTISLD